MEGYQYIQIYIDIYIYTIVDMYLHLQNYKTNQKMVFEKRKKPSKLNDT